MKKKILSTLLALTLSSSMFAQTALAVKMYAPDGRTASVADVDVKSWKAVGWYDYPVTKMYAPNGKTAVIAKSAVEDWKKVGWYTSKSITMYAADGRTKDVPLSEIAYRKSVGWYENPVSNNYVSSTPKGTLINPYSALSGTTISYSKWSFDPTRKVSIKCIDVLRGSVANSMVHLENMFNDTPNANQEWCLLEFDIKYISSTDGYDDVLDASDIIYKDTFFTSTGSSITVADMATFSHELEGYGVFDVELYPGSSGKVIIGLLINKNVDDILLRVPNKLQNTNSWILCK